MIVRFKYHDDELIRIKAIDQGDFLDLRSAKTLTMKKGEYKLISLGITVELPKGYEMHMMPRSSTFKNFGIIQTNSVGIIDNAFCGPEDIIHFPAYATRDTKIEFNDRICQFRLFKNQEELFPVEITTLKKESRGGFGSTGVK